MKNFSIVAALVVMAGCATEPECAKVEAGKAAAGKVEAKTAETKAPGFRADDFRRPYIEWYAPNPATQRVDLCVLFISGGGFGQCCDAERMQPAIDRFVQAGVTVANLTYRTPRPKGLPIHQS